MLCIWLPEPKPATDKMQTPSAPVLFWMFIWTASSQQCIVYCFYIYPCGVWFHIIYYFLSPYTTYGCKFFININWKLSLTSFGKGRQESWGSKCITCKSITCMILNQPAILANHNEYHCILLPISSIIMLVISTEQIYPFWGNSNWLGGGVSNFHLMLHHGINQNK